MAYDFLGLVNDVNSRLNEVALDSTNFATAVGYYNVAKDSVNAAIRHINQEEFEWPWNHVQSDLVLAAGAMKYFYPSDAKTINMNSFRIKRDNTTHLDSPATTSAVTYKTMMQRSSPSNRELRVNWTGTQSMTLMEIAQ